MKFGVIATLLPVTDMVKVGIAAEKYGFDSVWVPDHYVDLPPSGDRVDPWVVLSAIAAQTKKIMLSTAATDVLRYHPSKLAHVIVTLDELSGGRAMLGLGSGEAMNVMPFGIRWEGPKDRIRRVREAIEVMRLLWQSSRDHPASYRGGFYSLDDAWLDTPPSQQPYPPTFVAALASSLLLSLAGELGDGWLSGYNTLQSFKERVETVRKSAKLHGRDPDSIRIAQWFCAAFHEDESILKMARGAVAPEILLCADDETLSRHGFEVPERIRTTSKSKIIYTHSLATVQVATSAAHIAMKMSDELIDEFVPCGGSSYFIEVIDKYRKHGATDIVLRDVVGQIVKNSAESAIETIKSFSEKILPYFREQ
jgi:alkanesulfonate monooxygenase SsuD/methylene tetrahydromethanopterin reductase-like flavin-dependent oxidoreductase (luciferase family)